MIRPNIQFQLQVLCLLLRDQYWQRIELKLVILLRSALLVVVVAAAVAVVEAQVVVADLLQYFL